MTEQSAPFPAAPPDILPPDRWAYAAALLRLWPGHARCQAEPAGDAYRCPRCQTVYWGPLGDMDVPCRVQDGYVPYTLAAALSQLGMRRRAVTSDAGMAWHERPEARPDEVRYQGGEIDEIVIRGCDLHLEYMDSTHVWIGVSRGGEMLHIDLASRARIRTGYRDEGIGPKESYS